MTNQATDLNSLQQRFSEHWDATQFQKVVAFVQEEFNSNKACYSSLFEAIHRTNVDFNKYLERLVNVKFASSFAKFISQSIISSTGVNVLQAYQDARDEKAQRITKHLVNELDWKLVGDVATYTDNGKTFTLAWSDNKAVAKIQLGNETIYEKPVAGYGHEWMATLIDSEVFDHI